MIIRLFKKALDVAAAIRTVLINPLPPVPPALPAPKEEPVTSAPLYAEYARAWIVREVAKGLKSEIDYSGNLEKHVIPHFGTTPIDQIRTRDVRAFVEKLRSTTDLAPRTIRNIYAVLRNSLGDAVADEMIGRNPCVLRKGDLPPNDDVKADFKKLAQFTQPEVVQIIDSEEIPFRWRVLYATLFLTGARVGEALALTWDRFQFTTPILACVTISESYSSKRKKTSSTKTKVVRDVAIHPRLLPFIERWRDNEYLTHRGSIIEPSALVFSTPDGRNLSSTTVLRRFHRDLRTLGLRKRRIHDSRRTFVTLSCAAPGADKETLRLFTHARKGDVFNSYLETAWEIKCRELLKWEI